MVVDELEVLASVVVGALLPAVVGSFVVGLAAGLGCAIGSAVGETVDAVVSVADGILRQASPCQTFPRAMATRKKEILSLETAEGDSKDFPARKALLSLLYSHSHS